jgi:hypothetical protein
MTICEYAASPIVNAYVNLKEEFRKAKEFKENATQGKLPPKSSAPKPSGMAYLVFAGTVVTLLAPLKIVGCLVSLLLNYAYLPVTIILSVLMLLLQRIGWMEPCTTAQKCIGVVAFWPMFISMFMAMLTTAENLNDKTTASPIYLNKLHFLQMRLLDLV